MIHYFTKGIEKELESNLQIPLDKETLVYIELIKLAKNTHWVRVVLYILILSLEQEN